MALSPEAQELLDSGCWVGPMREVSRRWPTSDWLAMGVPDVAWPLTRMQRAMVALIWKEPSWISAKRRGPLRQAMQAINPAWDAHQIGETWRHVRALYNQGRLPGWETRRNREETKPLIVTLGAHHRVAPSSLTEGE